MRGGNRIDVPEHLTQVGATLLAERIVAYWAARGRQIAARVEPVTALKCTTHQPIYAVRSDLVFPVPQLSPVGAKGAPAHPGSTTTT